MDDFLTEAPGLLRLQAQAISEAADRLDLDAFGRAVELLCGCEGKVLLSGAGTSGVIARKIAATLTSTGTAAVFLHPADALHGALGIATPDDVAVLISNSGETDELLVLVPYLEHRKVPLIAVVGRVKSTLAARAEVVLDASAPREACPFNLSPTASTSVALAIGDALAMTVMKAKNVTPEDFALNHPSGTLGKRLTLKVSDVMRAGPDRPVVAVDDPWLDVVGRISAGGLGAATVEDPFGTLVGIITDGDVRRTIEQFAPEQLRTIRAADVMTSQPVTVTAASLAYDALLLMEERVSQINVLPVVDELGHCLGILRLHDLVRAGI